MEKLHGVPESMLIPVAARALETYEKNLLLKIRTQKKCLKGLIMTLIKLRKIGLLN